MKTPVSYYGGKQKLVSEILPLIPPHKLYAEVFAGGAAIFFAKSPSLIEVINDSNKELMNFYHVLKTEFDRLKALVIVTLHSRDMATDASIIYSNPHLFSPVQRAWAFWVLSSQCFASIIDSAWGFDLTSNTTTKRILNKINRFGVHFSKRISRVQLECTDALYILRSRDTEDTFFYVDPPYFGTDCGHYKGYRESDFKELLDVLSTIKGKFLLSSFPSELLESYKLSYGWEQRSIEQFVSVNAKSGILKPKIEVLTANYSLSINTPPTLF